LKSELNNCGGGAPPCAEDECRPACGCGGAPPCAGGRASARPRPPLGTLRLCVLLTGLETRGWGSRSWKGVLARVAGSIDNFFSFLLSLLRGFAKVSFLSTRWPRLYASRKGGKRPGQDNWIGSLHVKRQIAFPNGRHQEITLLTARVTTDRVVCCQCSSAWNTIRKTTTTQALGAVAQTYHGQSQSFISHSLCLRIQQNLSLLFSVSPNPTMRHAKGVQVSKSTSSRTL
jgi:hypothetical protein